MDGFEVISSYSRRQAIEDGMLVDITTLAKEAGFKIPVAVTNEMYERVLNPSEESKALGQSVEGRTWDMLNILRVSCKNAISPILLLKMDVQYDIETKTENYKAIIGPGDTVDPVLTVMLPHED